MVDGPLSIGLIFILLLQHAGLWKDTLGSGRINAAMTIEITKFVGLRIVSKKIRQLKLVSSEKCNKSLDLVYCNCWGNNKETAEAPMADGADG